ncbi:hypothetical protein M0R45_032385 [Rubus argutus]|uniref:Ubiquitin-specific protease family C19-related protein n=1 Tax=Rubus argutus TaxID=59490 RepID=A0AAW1WGP5_RUBAR
MGSRFPSHQLSNGLYVSGPPEQPKERTPTMSSVATPYTGGDIKKSGELGKMFDIPTDGSKSRKSGPITGTSSRTGSFGGAASHSGPISNAAVRAGSASLKKSNSGPLNKHGEPLKKSSGPQSGGGNTNWPPKLWSSSSCSPHNSPHYFWTHFFWPSECFWGPSKAGGFILGAVHNPILLVVVVILFGAVATLFTWNTYWGRRSIIGYIASYSDSELRTAKNGQFVKVSGVVTCGNVPLESSFQKVPRCVYTSTSLYEYRGWDSKAANPTHRRFSWGLRSMERRVVDFYISDFQSGLRALVKTGCGARVTPYVDDSFVIDVNPVNEELSPEFIRWLGERNLSSDDRVMQLKEGYIKEGSTVSVMGVVQRNENVLMIVPPPEPITTGCQWGKCIFPASLEGIVLRCDDASKNDVIAV